MDITPYVDSLRRDLLAAAEAGGPEVAAAAERGNGRSRQSSMIASI